MEHEQELRERANTLVAAGKGILAADESNRTMTKRLAAVGVQSTPETRRTFRELLFTAEGAERFVSGVIMYDETLRQSTTEGTPFPEALARRGIIPGIKVDTGAKPLALAPEEKVTEGLDGLRERLAEYRELGAGFAKWRAVITIGDELPSGYCIDVNAHALARYATLCQEAGIVPVVEPEVLMDGAHDIDRSYEATASTLHAVFDALFRQRVMPEGILLKPNMVLAGYQCPRQAAVEEVAAATLRCLTNVVPAAVPGIVFLSGGQSNELATAHLNAMNVIGGAPWELSFSYGRALQGPPLDAWRGEDGNAPGAQSAYLHRARCNGAARLGDYSQSLEEELVAS